MPDTRLTKRVFLWDLKIADQNRGISTWSSEVKDILTRNNMIGTFSLNPFNLRHVVEALETSLREKDRERLQIAMTRTPKLRTYYFISGDATTKAYLIKPLSFAQRKLLAKLRLGILPIRLESGRYERPPLSVTDRICKQCALGEVENEEHFMLVCPKHSFRRNILYSKIENKIDFNCMNNIEKLKLLLNNENLVKASSQYIVESYAARIT